MLKRKGKHLQATLVNLIKLESGQTHPANIFGGFHVFLHEKRETENNQMGRGLVQMCCFKVSAGFNEFNLRPFKTTMT